MVSSTYPFDLQDWKGRFIYKLLEALASQSSISVRLWAPPGQMPSQVSSACTVQEANWLHELSMKGGLAHLVRQAPIRNLSWIFGQLRRLYLVYRRENYDLVHVNWLQNAIPLLGTHTPLLVSVLGSDFALLRIPGMTTVLRRVFRQRRTIITPNAEWMVPRLQQAFGDIAEVNSVYFGVDKRWFGIRRCISNPPIWLSVSRITRKKLGHLLEWGQGLFGQNRQLHLFGPMQEPINIPSWIHYHGPSSPEQLMDTWFPQATGLITLSTHDEGQPQVILEAMAAGLPIIASDLPAHRNMIHHGRNGWIVQNKNEVERGLCELEKSAINQKIGNAAKVWVKHNIGTWEDCADRYLILYNKLTN